MERAGLRAGFLVDKKGNIKMHTVEGIDYVSFYKDDHIILIPYEFLVCFVAHNINEPKPVPPNVASLEKLIIDGQKNSQDYSSSSSNKIFSAST